MSNSNTKDSIRAASLFNFLPIEKQEIENRNLSILLGGVSVKRQPLERDEDYRARIFSELLAQLPPDSEYPSAFVRTYPPPNSIQLRVGKKTTFELVEEFEEGRSNESSKLKGQISDSSKVEKLNHPPSETRGSLQDMMSILKDEKKPWVSVEDMNVGESTKVEPFVPPASFEILTPPLLKDHRNREIRDSDQHRIIISKDEHNKCSNSMQKFTSREVPKLLNKTAGKSSCSILRVPQSIMEIHPKAFEPQIVSIGPFHHGKEHLNMIQEHKQRFLDAILARIQENCVTLDDFYKAIAKKNKQIRECYSENTDKYSDYEFIEMMVLDGCFIIELFSIVGRLVQTDHNDPIFILPWILYTIMRDLLRLENQIPFSVLQTLFDLIMSGSRKVPSLTELALGFFNYSMQRPEQIRAKHYNLDCKHLLDLFRSSFLPPVKELATTSNDKDFLQLIQPVEKLRIAGIKIKKPVETNVESFLDIKFSPNGVLEIPALSIDDFIGSFLLNCVAFEQCYKHCSNHFTSYVVFMGCLVNTPMDAGYLRDYGIIDNYFGTDKEVVKFFNEVGKEIYFDIERSYLARVFEDVNHYYRNDWHVTWAGFKYTYFDSPWAFMSALAALILLILTIIQAFFAVYGYVHPPQ